MGCRYSAVADPRVPSVPEHAPVRTRGAKPSPSSLRRKLAGFSHQQQSRDFEIEVDKKPNDKLGVSLGNTSKGAVIFNVKATGLLARYNEEANEELRLRAGYIIVDVNGSKGYWDMFEEMRKSGPLKMVISPTPPTGASASWFEEIENMGKDLNLESQGNNFVMRVKPHNAADGKGAFSSLPMVRAGDIEVDQCAICLADVEPNESLVRLPCSHAFHVTCAGRWLTEKGDHTRGKKQSCPLCCRRVVGDTAEDEN
jgi:hypothetical protein